MTRWVRFDCFCVSLLCSHAFYITTSTASDHKACLPDDPSGCQRCIISASLICCKLCSPRIFEDFAVVDLSLRPKPRPGRSRIQSFKPNSHDMDLRNALHDFRKQRTIDKFGLPALKNNGPGMIMTNQTLQRIIDCAHCGKITDSDELAKETHWTRAGEYGKEILSLIKAHQQPLTPSTADSLAPVSATTSNHQPDVPMKTTKKRVCSKCQGIDHIGECCTVSLILF
jgi:hypothetical protein